MNTQNTITDALAAGLADAGLKLLAPSTIQNRLREQYAEIAVPTRKTEPYRYSSLGKEFNRTRKPAANSTNSKHTEYLLDGIDQYAVAVNGVLRPELSNITMPGVTLKPLSEAVKDAELSALMAQRQTDKFSALNAAFATAGFYISIQKNTVCQSPLQILFISSADGEAISNVRNAVIAGEGSSIKIIQTQAVVSGQMLTNIHTDIVVKDSANVEYNLLADEKDTDILVANITADQHRNSQFTANLFNLNGGSVRENLLVNQNGEFCKTAVNGISLASRSQHLDSYLVVNHNVPNGTTDEIFRCIAKDESTCAFAGTIYVAPGAQKTLASQSNKNILLSDNATIHSKPQLEIFADDVSCNHGSTTGQLDPQQIFYMQARGIDRDKAIHLLLSAFFGDAIDNLTIPALAERIEFLIENKI